jgi:hypothetical protein
MNEYSQLLRMRNATRHLLVSPRTVARLVISGELETLTIGRCHRVSLSCLQRYIDTVQHPHRADQSGYLCQTEPNSQMVREAFIR